MNKISQKQVNESAAINALGVNGNESASYLANFAGRMAGIEPAETDERKKGLVIIGAAESGKTVLANSIASHYDPDQVFRINGRIKGFSEQKFIFSGLTANHKVIVIDDCTSLRDLQSLCVIVGNEIVVNKPGQWAATLTCPRIIVTADLQMIKIKNLGSSFMRRFVVIELKSCGYTDSHSKGLEVSSEV